jgi:hypothetical protein
MLFENKKELDNIMNRFNNDIEGLQEQKNKERTEQEEFIKEFERLKHEIIWPVIADVGNQMNEYKHDFHVSEEEEYVDATANFQPASITLNIYPATLDKASYKPESTPYISFIANRYAKKIGIMVSTMMPAEGGVIGSHGEYTLDQVTKEFVEKEIVEVLKNTLFLHNTKE